MAYEKKIAFILPSLRGAGAERVVLNLAREFALRGYGVDIVALKKEGSFAATVPNGITVVDLECSRALVALPALIGYLRRARPESVISALPHINILSIVASSLARVGVGVIVTEHNPFSSDFATAHFLKRALLAGLMRILYPHAEAVVAVSQGVARDIVHIIGSPTMPRVIYNPVITPDLATRAAAMANHPWLGEKRGPIILGAGRLTKQKDFETLIWAFARINKSVGAKLIILGEGEEREALERLIAELGIGERVSMPGFVKNPYAFMARSDVFVLSSLWEGFGNVLVEAMACGTSVVATDCAGGGPREILEGGVYGPLVKPGDVDALAGALEATIGSPANENALRARAEVFGAARAADSYEALITKGVFSVVTFADIGRRSNLKTPGILPILSTFQENHRLGQVLCRMGGGSLFPNTVSTVPRSVHYVLRVVEKLSPLPISLRDLEETFSDRIAALRLRRADVVLFHPEFAFPRTLRKARKIGGVTVGIATVAHPLTNQKLFQEEVARVPGYSIPAAMQRRTERASFTTTFDGIIALSDFVRDSYQEAGFPSDRIVVAHPDIDGVKFFPRQKGDDVFRVVYIAHTTVLKGLHYLLEAWKGANLPNAELVIVGGYSAGTPSALKDWYARMGEGDSTIRWVGETKDPQEWYQDASVVVFPSLTEGFGRVTLEAMSCGVPVIATEHAKGIIEDGVSGFIVPVRDSRAIRAKLQMLFQDPKRCARMGAAAREASQKKKPFGVAVYEICETMVGKKHV